MVSDSGGVLPVDDHSHTSKRFRQEGEFRSIGVSETRTMLMMADLENNL
jgi:hypothetical protein